MLLLFILHPRHIQQNNKNIATNAEQNKANNERVVDKQRKYMKQNFYYIQQEDKSNKIKKEKILQIKNKQICQSLPMLPSINGSPHIYSQPTKTQSSNIPYHKLNAFISNARLEKLDPLFLNNERIILPVKQYSNRFLREHKIKQDPLYNRNIIKPKRSTILMKKQFKSLKYRSEIHHSQKQNIQTHKTQSSKRLPTTILQPQFSQIIKSLYTHEKRPKKRSQIKQLSLKNHLDKISTSRALQMFCKIFKNSNIQRTKIKKQLNKNLYHVHTKQLTLIDKDKCYSKSKILSKTGHHIDTQNIKRQVSVDSHLFSQKNSNLYSQKDQQSLLHHSQDINFQLAGW